MNNIRSMRLEKAMEDIAAIDVEVNTPPNPDCLVVYFRLERIPDGTIIKGESFFDLRKKITESLHRRGFELMVDNQGMAPLSMTIRDRLPEGCEDGEILGIDRDGFLLQWNADDLEIYNSAETVEEFGEANIRPHEWDRIRPPASIIITQRNS